ncbi:TIGR03546 family protein [Pseudidiomarina terrestris]|uniref:TIGR03546 family protein n=1 Tax=Pseudidiomarina terrestris TaxID=2820060 RepID=A0AAW7QYD2_9GAMM|nr:MULTISPECIES: TIGR03546 family protein [unclassified Pseudidiomarina]MDN7125167.1 TIGR03546 family protein [Pseudidiomarina sp. 1APP75-32.1]MDN7127430.1 TIGR03546 family protein [Pseudidiomarina sp. 1APR75-33.1]MDN7129928.1 TIGR03546 family protein [Pseudidiomarina sp. 1APR75-15]MDN7136094.1 TIGR03546 family protein [Pseudidiomarina sp. 1ASP75-5]MDN7138381.1 TIGR03546 family protein [Pseudidiomarina sp. 1ASP75-14]
MLTLLARLLRALNSESGAWALAIAFVLGMIMGFTPLWRVHNLVILLIALLFRVNLSGFILSFVICSGLAFLLDPVFHQVGFAILSAESWQPVWQGMYDSAFWRVVQFHHTITLGSLVISLAFAPILAILSFWLVTQYRRRIQVWFNKLKIVQALKANRFWAVYSNLRG